MAAPFLHCSQVASRVRRLHVLLVAVLAALPGLGFGGNPRHVSLSRLPGNSSAIVCTVNALCGGLEASTRAHLQQ